MKTAKPNTRRNFLLAAGLGTVGTAVAVATASKGKVASGPAPAAGEAAGYQASAHVLKYYETTKV